MCIYEYYAPFLDWVLSTTHKCMFTYKIKSPTRTFSAPDSFFMIIIARTV